MATTTFSMRIDADVKRRLEERAAHEDRSAAYIATEAIEDFLAREDAMRASIREAIAEADKGVFISGGAVER